ncbi:MAG: hypothetical protein JRH16_12810 [Deltaproteobacteria bacterium]|nr:hypothetical protein [Deltaproteobacteria bacterium]MBW2361001.1 hypothetical protein [Deltaproteobacteria bacterium]
MFARHECAASDVVVCSTHVRVSARSRFLDTNLFREKVDAREQTVTLIVSDKGRGFRPEQVQGGGLGILGMRERVELLGGRFELVSQPGEGTRIRADLPLAAT